MIQKVIIWKFYIVLTGLGVIEGPKCGKETGFRSENGGEWVDIEVDDWAPM